MSDDYEQGYQDAKMDEVVPLLEEIDELAQKIIQLEDRIAELEVINFSLSEDSALVANENAELRAVLKELLVVVEGENPHFGLMGMIDGYYHDFLDDVDPVVERARAALATAGGVS